MTVRASDSPCMVSHTSQSNETGKSRTWLKDLIILTIASAVWFCALLGTRPLSNPDEGRYGEIPREMAVTGDFVTPRLNGVKYFEKPPLVYWLSAMTFKQFGANKFTARIWNALIAVAGLLMTYTAARILHGRMAGFSAAIVLGTTLMYYVISQIVLLDMAVAVTMSGALFSFILAMREPRGRKRFLWFMAFYICMALATLSKGLIGIALPGAVIFLWVLLLNRWRALWPFYPLVGTVLLLAIAGPWHVLAARANPDFLNFYFIHEHWLRFTTRIHNRYEPWWFFLPFLIGGLFPWIFFSVQSLRVSLPGGWKHRKDAPEAWFFVIWIVFIVAFFSRSQSKLIPYILPVFPAAAVMLGAFLASVWESKSTTKIRNSTWAFVTVAFLLVVATVVAPTPPNQPELAAILPYVRIFIGCVVFFGAIGAIVGLRRNQGRIVLGAIILSSGLTLIGVNFGGGAFNKMSTEDIADVLKPRLQPSDRVYTVGFYAQDLPFYLDRVVSVANKGEDRSELKYGIDAEPEKTASRFLNRQGFVQQWSEPGIAYAVVSKAKYDNWFSQPALPHQVLARTTRFVLVSNLPTTPPL